MQSDYRVASPKISQVRSDDLEFFRDAAFLDTDAKALRSRLGEPRSVGREEASEGVSKDKCGTFL